MNEVQYRFAVIESIPYLNKCDALGLFSFSLHVQKLRQIEQLKQQQSEGKLLESNQVT